jgi:ABC-type amino acid transport substrate-binding protein
VFLLAGWQSEACAREELPFLRVAVDTPNPPFAVLDKRGNVSGFDVDITYALCTELKRTCIIKPMAFEGIISAIVAEEVDIAVAGMGVTEERLRLVDFTDKYYRSLSLYIGRRGVVRGLSPEELKGLRIGAQRDTIQEQYLRQHFKNTATIVPVATQDTALNMASNGQLDLVLVDGLGGYAFLKTEAGAVLEIFGDPLADANMTSACIAVSKKQPELRDAINHALQTLRRNGEYGKINRKYFNFNIY